MTLKGWQAVVFFAFTLTGLSAMAASPSADDIYRTAKSGHLAEAQQMADQVLAEHPNSAKAHFVAAEIYAREGKFAIARKELETAEQLKPGLPFVKPEAVAALKNFLGMPGGASAGGQGSFPFGTLMLGILAIGVVIAVIKLSAARAANRAPYYPGGNAPGQTSPGQPMQGQPYPGGGTGGGMGSSIMGGLATGAAVGAGIVAGEALAHHFLDGDNANAANAGAGTQHAQNTDLGGENFGITDAGGWDDNTTFADFGGSDFGGGDDWS